MVFPLLGIFISAIGFYTTQDWRIQGEMVHHLKGYTDHWFSKEGWDRYQSSVSMSKSITYRLSYFTSLLTRVDEMLRDRVLEGLAWSRPPPRDRRRAGHGSPELLRFRRGEQILLQSSQRQRFLDKRPHVGLPRNYDKINGYRLSATICMIIGLILGVRSQCVEFCSNGQRSMHIMYILHNFVSHNPTRNFCGCYSAEPCVHNSVCIVFCTYRSAYSLLPKIWPLQEIHSNFYLGY